VGGSPHDGDEARRPVPGKRTHQASFVNKGRAAFAQAHCAAKVGLGDFWHVNNNLTARKVSHEVSRGWEGQKIGVQQAVCSCHHTTNLVRALRINLSRVGPLHLEHVPGKL
jgi:hypothetical protein